MVSIHEKVFWNLQNKKLLSVEDITLVLRLVSLLVFQSWNSSRVEWM